MSARSVRITGIGLVSSLGDGVSDHWHALTAPEPRPTVQPFIASCHVHPLVAIDFSRHIPNPGEVRRMGQTQRIGVYAAGAALEDAGLKGDAARLTDAKIIVASDGGERDVDVDEEIFANATAYAGNRPALTEKLAASLQPSLFLSELPNLLAGHISIIHRMHGGTRTLMGGEAAGHAAFAEAVALIRDGSCDIVLIGSAFNAERPDRLLLATMDGQLWSNTPVPVWSRAGRGGVVFGSIGAFLVLESAAHASARNARQYGSVGALHVGSAGRQPGAIAQQVTVFVRDACSDGLGFGVISTATGDTAITGEERQALESLTDSRRPIGVRAIGTMLGHGVEAAFPVGICVAAMAVDRGKFYPPFSEDETTSVRTDRCHHMLVTSFDRRRGDALARIDAVDAPDAPHIP